MLLARRTSLGRLVRFKIVRQNCAVLTVACEIEHPLKLVVYCTTYVAPCIAPLIPAISTKTMNLQMIEEAKNLIETMPIASKVSMNRRPENVTVP